MPTLRLFRNTEFALSSLFFSPEQQRAATHPAWIIVATSLWIATVCNLALWRALWRLPELHSAHGLWFGIGFAVAIAAATGAILSLLCWRWTFKPTITLLLLIAAAGTYFMLDYGVVIDPTMMVNVLQTNPREVADLLNWRLAVTVLVLALLPALWLWPRPLRRIGRWRQLRLVAISLIASIALFIAALAIFYMDFASVMRNHKELRYLVNPLNTLYALGDLAVGNRHRQSGPLVPIGTDAKLGAIYRNQTRPPLLLLVLGETGRAGNFGLNGYARDTTPELARAGVVSERNAWSCGTSTATSVPCMFSDLDRAEFEASGKKHESLLDLLQRLGFAVLWIDNQAGCKGVCDRVPHVNTSNLRVPGLCSDGECLDGVMLVRLDQRIAALPAAARARGVVLVLHQMGSHGPAYYKRSPPAYKKFLPECESNALETCDRQQVVNAYDNSILYTDHFLASCIEWLKAQESWAAPAMVYVADHGESLGENNIYLHGLPYQFAPDVQKHVPWITWLSPAFQQRTGISMTCLEQQRDRRISHDDYFDSVLGLLDVQTRLYRRAHDVYADCGKAPHPGA